MSQDDIETMVECPRCNHHGPSKMCVTCRGIGVCSVAERNAYHERKSDEYHVRKINSEKP
jgi:hypothetical protein